MLARYAGSGGVYDGFVVDLTVAWDDVAARDQDLAACVRFALIATSVASVAANFPPPLVAEALKTGLWDPARALSAAARAGGEELYRVALESRRLDRPAQVRAQRAALERVLATEREDHRAEALARLAPHLDDNRVEQALTAARALDDPALRATTLAALGHTAEAHEAAATIEDARKRAAALTATLPAEDPRAALDAARQIDWHSDRVKALAEIAARLDPGDRRDVAEEALEQALALEDFDLAFELQRVLPILDEAQRERLIAAALPRIGALDDIDREYDMPRPVGLIALGPYLRGDELAQGRAFADDLSAAGPVQSIRSDVLAALARAYDGPDRAELLREALGVASEETFSPYRIGSLVEVADLLEDDERTAIVREALEGARGLPDRAQEDEPSPRLKALGALAPLLSGELLERALAAAGEIKDYEQQARALVALAELLDGDPRAAAMNAAFDAVWRLKDDQMGIFTIEEILPRLDGPVLAVALDAALTLPVGGAFTSDRARAVKALAPCLSNDLLQRAWEAARALENPFDRAEALTAVAGRLEGDQRTEAARLAFAAIPDISGAPHLHANAVFDLGPYVPEDLAVEAWNYVVSLEQELSTYGSAALAAVAPQFDTETAEASMEAVTASLGDDDLVAALAGLIPKLEGATRQDALATAIKTTLEGSVAHEKAAVKLAPFLDAVERESVLSRGLQAARDYGNDEFAADGLIALLPYLDAEQRTLARADAVARALRVREPRRRAELILKTLEDGAVTPPDSTDPGILACFARQTPALVPQVRTLLLDRLSELKGRPRSDVLELIAHPALFAPPILTSDAVATAVEDICHTWSWV